MRAAGVPRYFLLHRAFTRVTFVCAGCCCARLFVCAPVPVFVADFLDVWRYLVYLETHVAECVTYVFIRIF